MGLGLLKRAGPVLEHKYCPAKGSSVGENDSMCFQNIATPILSKIQTVMADKISNTGGYSMNPYLMLNRSPDPLCTVTI